MSAVHSAIAKRFAAPEWATFFEVRDATGFKSQRSADAVSMGIWPSRGLQLIGFEVKVSRSDWLRELKDPAKSAPIQTYCDRWYVAVSGDDIVKDGELPSTWGLLVLRGSKLVQKVEAPVLKPEPLTRTFIASLLRCSTENVVSKHVIDQVVEERVTARVTSKSEWDERKLKHLESETAELRKHIDEFERASGVRIRDWQGSTKVGQAVKLVLEDGRRLEQHIERVKSSMTDLAERAERALSELRESNAANETEGASA